MASSPSSKRRRWNAKNALGSGCCHSMARPPSTMPSTPGLGFTAGTTGTSAAAPSSPAAPTPPPAGSPSARCSTRSCSAARERTGSRRAGTWAPLSPTWATAGSASSRTSCVVLVALIGVAAACHLVWPQLSSMIARVSCRLRLAASKGPTK
ncbi:hypothetical protein ACP4OV_025348 [Aristida adscensionis]